MDNTTLSDTQDSEFPETNLSFGNYSAISEWENMQTEIPAADETPTQKEREMKKRYLGQINKIARERDEMKKRLEATEQLKQEAEEAGRWRERYQEKETEHFFATHPHANDFKTEIADIRQTFPQMSWEEATNFCLASTAPEHLLDGTAKNRLHAKKTYIPAQSSASVRQMPDMQDMSAKEYGSYVQELLKRGKIRL